MISDIPSNCNFVSNVGCSIVDYILLSSHLFSFVNDMFVFSCRKSDHMLIVYLLITSLS